MAIDLVCVDYKTPGDLQNFYNSLMSYPPVRGGGHPTLTVVETDETLPSREVRQVGWNGSNSGVWMRPGENLGYAKACNLAAIAGSNEVLAFFNADVMVTPDAIDVCIEVLLSDPSVAVVGPRQVDTQNRLTHAGIVNPGVDRFDQSLMYPRNWQEPDRGQMSHIEEVLSVAGSAYFVRRSVWDELNECHLYQHACFEIYGDFALGAFLPTQHYYEESYLSLHARAHGYRVMYVGETTIVHKWHQASPVGGVAELVYQPQARAEFRRACDIHGIIHD